MLLSRHVRRAVERMAVRAKMACLAQTFVPQWFGDVMTQPSDTISYRVAKHDDETDILEVLEEVAPEIPVRLDGPERQAKIKTEIVQCRRSGKTWVAVDAGGRLVGFVLARPDAHEGKAAIYMPYIGVRKGSRRRGIFSTFMDKFKANGVALTASVLHDN